MTDASETPAPQLKRQINEKVFANSLSNEHFHSQTAHLPPPTSAGTPSPLEQPGRQEAARLTWYKSRHCRGLWKYSGLHTSLSVCWFLEESLFSGSDFLPCSTTRRVLSPLPMFSRLREYLFKAIKTASKKKKRKEKGKPPPLPKAESW